MMNTDVARETNLDDIAGRLAAAIDSGNQAIRSIDNALEILVGPSPAGCDSDRAPASSALLYVLSERVARVQEQFDELRCLSERLRNRLAETPPTPRPAIPPPPLPYRDEKFLADLAPIRKRGVLRT